MRVSNLFKSGGGLLVILAVVVTFGCATQKKKEDKRSPTDNGELATFGDKDGDGDNPTMEALENAAEDAAKGLFDAANEAEDPAERDQLQALGEVFDGVADVADEAEELSGDEVGEICAGVNLTLDAMGLEQEAKDPRNSRKWLAWAALGAVLIAGGVIGDQTGRSSVDSALKKALGDDVDTKVAREAFLKAGSSDADKKLVLKQLKVYAAQEKAFVEALSGDGGIDKADAKRLYGGLYGPDGKASDLTKTLYDGEGNFRGDSELRKALADIPGGKGVAPDKFKPALAANEAGETTIAAREAAFKNAVAADDSKIDDAVKSANTNLNRWFRNNGTAKGAAVGAGIFTLLYAGYQGTKGSLSLTETTDDLSANGEAALQRSALMVDSASAGCDAPQPGETI